MSPLTKLLPSVLSALAGKMSAEANWNLISPFTITPVQIAEVGTIEVLYELWKCNFSPLLEAQLSVCSQPLESSQLIE